jgi:hypothetical protein
MSKADELRSMSDHDLLIRVATKLEELVGNGQPGRCASHSNRIRKLEQWRSYLAGAIAVLSFLGMVGGGILASKIR